VNSGGFNYSTIFLILFTFGSGIYALYRLRRGFRLYSKDYLRFFSYRHFADLFLTAVWSILWLAGIPMYDPTKWEHGLVPILLLYCTGVICLLVATFSQVSTAQLIAQVPGMSKIKWLYGSSLALILLVAVSTVWFGPISVSETANGAMLVFALFSRSLSLVTSIPLFGAEPARNNKKRRRALTGAGVFFVLVDGTWIAFYLLGAMGFLHSWIYDGLHLSRMTLVSLVIALYLNRFLDAFEGAGQAQIQGRPLDQYLVEKYGISKREEEVISFLCMGKTNDEIAQALFISERTVKGHIYRIFQKTNARNRVQLANLFGDRFPGNGETKE
jgi:DNA-binding CsgD family transcriptional regulator